ncbi:hypothetical protein [Vibrio cholerae]|uniref:hypothetical protein n=1 Tax=Vibrio cholerae TaxID=666 RepID=UPI001C6842B3|nr:hypothetical protein [Vibrio cholerae]
MVFIVQIPKAVTKIPTTLNVTNIFVFILMKESSNPSYLPDDTVDAKRKAEKVGNVTLSLEQFW